MNKIQSFHDTLKTDHVEVTCDVKLAFRFLSDWILLSSTIQTINFHIDQLLPFCK